MDLDSMLRFLNLDAKSRRSLIESHPLLKKYFSKDPPKRNPKYLDSELAKKLEDPKHRLTEKYYSLKDQVYNLLQVEEFDQLRKVTYIATYESIIKNKDPEEMNSRLAQLYSQIKQDIQFYIGQEDKATQNLPVEDQISQSIIIGSKDFRK